MNPPASSADTRDAGSIPHQKDPLEQEMPTCSSILAWRIPRTEGSGGLQSMESQRVGHNCDCAQAYTSKHEQIVLQSRGQVPCQLLSSLMLAYRCCMESKGHPLVISKSGPESLEEILTQTSVCSPMGCNNHASPIDLLEAMCGTLSEKRI